MKYELILGDAEVLIGQRLLPNSVHAVITDPPYGINVLNLDWDRILPSINIWKACYDVLRPGGYCIAFSHARIYHRLGCQLEDAGFIVRDCLCWAYATGNPRPLNIDRSIDKHFDQEGTMVDDEYVPVSEEGKKWKGWANCLKTSWEPIIMAQKPLEGGYIDNVMKYNVGGLNIDECRIPYRDEKDKQSLQSFQHFAGKNYGDSRYFAMNDGAKKQCNVHPDGRWPANLIWADPLFVQYDHIFMVPKPSRTEKKEYNSHDTVKPVCLMERLVKLVTPNPSIVKEPVVVLDPFCGSGTTGIACKNLFREFEGYEKDVESYNVARKRLIDCVKNWCAFGDY